jgi:hypothetical protein
MLEALFHTNRPLLQSPVDMRATSGWWGEQAVERLGDFKVTGPYRKCRESCPRKLKHRWNLPQMLKYEWALTSSHAASDLLILADTDSVFQCTPRELRARFASFGTPLVVGTERWLFPRPIETRGARDPFAVACSGPSEDMRYPNSGLMMGTRRGFETLLSQMSPHSAEPSFPCCSFSLPSTECFVDDQACLHTALLRLKLGTWPRATRRRRGCMPPADREARAAALPSTFHTIPTRAAGVQTRGSSRTLQGRSPVTQMARFQSLGNASGVHLVHHPNGTADYALDVSTSLFMTMFMLHTKELGVNSKGQLIHTRTGHAPCIIHTNAYATCAPHHAYWGMPQEEGTCQ